MRPNNFSITVSEPWNFESPDGKNIIKGLVMEILNNHCLIFKSHYILRFDDLQGDTFVLSPRIQECDFSNLKNEIDINGGLLPNKFDFGVKDSRLKELAKFVIIGSLQKDM